MPRKKQTETDFGERLAELRKARGLTQVELADKIGSSQRAISYYENVASYPPAQVLIEIANALHVTTDELLGIKQTKAKSSADSSEERRLWKKFQQLAKLPEKDQRAVIRLVNSLVSANRR